MYDHMTDERFLFLMAGLAEASGQEANPMRIKVYAKALEDIHINALEAAAWQLIRTRTFATFPKPGEIREAIEGKPADRAEVEAGKVWSAIESIGPYRTVCFDDPVTQAVITYHYGSWAKVCETEEDRKWFTKDFCKAYEAFSRQNLKVMGPLTGLGAGKNDPSPRLIGDTRKALEIAQQKPAERGRIELLDNLISEF